MYNEKITATRMRAWLIASTAAPAAIFAGGSPWPAVLGVAAVSCMAAFASRSGRVETMHPVMLIIQWLWLCVLLGVFAANCGTCWPEGDSERAVPLTLIVLACLNAQKGSERASRSTSALLWAVVLLLGAAAVTGLESPRREWMKTQWSEFDFRLVPILLIPCLCEFLPVENRKYRSAVIWTAVIAGISAFWLNASLSETISAQQENPLYEYSKSISMMGTVKRMESVIACGITLSWFSLFSLVAAAAGMIAESWKGGLGTWGTWGCGIGASVCLLSGIEPGDAVTGAITAVLWVVLPALAGFGKKMQKKEKKA